MPFAFCLLRPQLFKLVEDNLLTTFAVILFLHFFLNFRKTEFAADGAPDIPYPRVRVEWIDCVSDSGWATDKEFDKMKLARPVNEGCNYGSFR